MRSWRTRPGRLDVKHTHRRVTVVLLNCQMFPLATLCTDCAKETCVREKSGTVDQLEGRGESVSSSVTDDQPSEETNLLLTVRTDDDCLTPVNNFPREVLKPLENLGEGIFGEVFIFLCYIPTVSM